MSRGYRARAPARRKRNPSASGGIVLADWKMGKGVDHRAGYDLARPHGRYFYSAQGWVHYYNRTHEGGVPTSSWWVGMNDLRGATKLIRPHDRTYTKNMKIGEAWAARKRNPPKTFVEGDLVRHTADFRRSIGMFAGGPVDGVVVGRAKGLNFPVVYWSSGSVSPVNPTNIEHKKVTAGTWSASQRSAAVREGKQKYAEKLAAEAAEEAAFWASPEGRVARAKIDARKNPQHGSTHRGGRGARNASAAKRRRNAGSEFVLWGLPKGETDALYAKVLYTQAKSLDDVKRVQALAARDGWHSFRIQTLDLSEPFNASAAMAGAVGKRRRS